MSSEADQTVMGQIQARFEVAVPELPDKIDSASYSELPIQTLMCVSTDRPFSDLLISYLSRSCNILSSNYVSPCSRMLIT